MSTTSAAPVRLAPGRAGGRSRTVPAATLAVALVVTLACLARLHTPAALWLDEAQSVGISRRPLPELIAALRRDGSPPLYYLLLHGWIELFGRSDNAVRALSTLFSLATLPLVWLSARRLGGPLAARSALVLLAVSPFAVRFATETRMYALVQLLTAAGVLALLRALERPTLARLLPVALLSGLLALTHYWALFLLAAVGAALLALARRGPDRRAAGRTLVALVCGGVVFLPWLPNFLFQMQRTGTPWAARPGFVDAYRTVGDWAGGGRGGGVLLTLTLLSLVVLAVCGRRIPDGVAIGRPTSRTALVLLAASLGTLALGLAVGMVLHAGYASRYSSVAFVPAVLLAALGVRVLPDRARLAVFVLVAVTGLVGSLPQAFSKGRTEAGITARLIRSGLIPGDLVVYCPDQLGPAVSRLLPPKTDQIVYPTGGSPEIVDWVDYQQRNTSAWPERFAYAASARTDGAIWLVSARGYRTFGKSCERIASALQDDRGEGYLVHAQIGFYEEQQAVTRYPGRIRTG